MFSIFFTILNLYLIWLFLTINSELKYILLCFIVNISILSIAYFLNRPELILGKNKKGEIVKLLLILNLPWLLFTWSIFKIQMIVSRENRVDEIIGTTISISSKPLGNFDYKKYDLVIDLTAEFLKDRVENERYICYPNLDGVALRNIYNDIAIFQNKKILVHCANGHGRSALFVAKLLLDMKLVKDFNDGLALIRKNRPLAYPNWEQKKTK